MTEVSRFVDNINYLTCISLLRFSIEYGTDGTSEVNNNTLIKQQYRENSYLHIIGAIKKHTKQNLFIIYFQ